jgi:hypothetical protein
MIRSLAPRRAISFMVTLNWASQSEREPSMLRRASLLVPLVLLLGRPGQTEAGPVMIPVNTTMANANGMLSVTVDFTINTGTTAKPTTPRATSPLAEASPPTAGGAPPAPALVMRRWIDGNESAGNVHELRSGTILIRVTRRESRNCRCIPDEGRPALVAANAQSQTK